MKKTDHKSLALSLALLGTALCPTSVFAAGNDYNIVYDGGVDLGNTGTVTVAPNLTSNLASIMTAHTKPMKLTFAQPGSWSTGYVYDDTWGCRPFNYVLVSDTVHPSNLTVTASTEKYDVDVNIKKTSTEDFGSGYTVTMGFANGTLALYAGSLTFADQATCESTHGDTTPQVITGTHGLSPRNEGSGKLFVETELKIRQKDANDKLLSSDEIYYGITDIDSAQSHKILNNPLTKDNMFTEKPSDLQEAGNSLKNKFVASGNYIYSQYSKDEPWVVRINDERKNNIYVKLGDAARTNGVNAVYGFANGAGSGIDFYAKQYTVNYNTDGHGTTDPSSEDVPSGNNPAGSNQTPADGYEFDHWTTDKDVKLDDGTTIKAGESITAEQIKKVIVHDNLTFTAHYKKVETTPKLPNTGSSTKEIDAAGIATISVAAVLGLALSIRVLPRIMHKKIGFKR